MDGDRVLKFSGGNINNKDQRGGTIGGQRGTKQHKQGGEARN